MTGPCFPLRVMRCHAHGRYFTLYPRGHVPYGREAVAPVAPDGQPTATGPDRFAETVLGAALDAARGRIWPALVSISEQHCYTTMVGRLRDVERWLGVEPGIEQRVRVRRATDLDVDSLLLLDASKAIHRAVDECDRGAALLLVLDRLPHGPPLLEGLLRAGHAAGLLGEPLVPARRGGPLRSLARERGGAGALPGGRDPP